MEKMMTITEVAKMLGISPRTIERWEETGKVKKSKWIREVGGFIIKKTLKS
jgi:excisionase family DNA binding protein